jgi:ribosomal protein S18 acetylase RimI-like enzyme
MQPFTVRLADLHCSDDQQSILELLDHYASDLRALGQPLPAVVRNRLIEGLKNFPTTRIFLAQQDASRAAGMATCFVGFSTFRALPLINIHDLVVHQDQRGQGIGSQLIDSIVQYSKDLGFCAVTLEVRYDNPAKKLYEKKGFKILESPVQAETMLFGKLVLPDSCSGN